MLKTKIYQAMLIANANSDQIQIRLKKKVLNSKEFQNIKTLILLKLKIRLNLQITQLIIYFQNKLTLKFPN